MTNKRAKLRGRALIFTGSILIALGAGCGGKVVIDAPSQGGGGGQGGADGCTSDACDDFNACTTDSCSGGVCVFAPINTDDGNACTSDGCDPKTGVFHGIVNPNDGNACTSDACDPSFGVTYQPISCDDGDKCTADSCDPSFGCTSAPQPIDDNNACTIDGCSPLDGPTHFPIDCNDKDLCTADSCNPAAGCSNVPVGGAEITVFSETFTDNSAGWQLDPGWQIGATAISGGQSAGFGTDPANDHTNNQPGGGIAGVFLGGNVPPMIHTPYYLTSPGLDLSSFSSKITLRFYRVLNSDYPPFMDSTVEVWDGASWVTKFSVPQGMIVADNTGPGTTWTKIEYDVSTEAAKNKSFQVRWGFNVNQDGVFDVGSWNIDDVAVLVNTPCP